MLSAVLALGIEGVSFTCTVNVFLFDAVHMSLTWSEEPSAGKPQLQAMSTNSTLLHIFPSTLVFTQGSQLVSNAFCCSGSYRVQCNHSITPA